MDQLIVTSKNTKPRSSREKRMFVLGLVLGAFLFAYSIFIQRNMAYTLFGIVIIIVEIVIYLKSGAEYRSYVAVFENRVEGCAVSEANSMINISFSLSFSEIKSIERKGEMMIIVTENGSYICRPGEKANEIKHEITVRKNRQ